jgi:peptidoglycan hydrolase-like protein with peptidoglycan-binding domain
MATGTEQQSPEQLEQKARELGLSPSDIPGGLGGLSDLLDLAKKLGIDPKDLIFGAKNSSLVTVVNRTKVSLYFQSEATEGTHGGFRTPPPDEIAPGQSATFLSEQSDISIHTGDEQKIVYAVGDSTACLWTLHWDNPDVGDCSADQSLAYPGGQTRPDGTRLEYQGAVAFGQGAKTLAPFEFIVREEGFGGGGDGVVDHNSCVVTVINHTKQSLFLAETHSDQGEFASFPDDEIPAGGSTTFNVTEKRRADHEREGVTGFARYTVTQDPSKCIWTVFWNNPEAGANIANDRLDGPDAEHYQRGPAEIPEDQKENAPVRFILRDAPGGGGTHPVDPPIDPPHVEPEPVQVGEPTLRIHDRSADGWVEYLQQLLNRWGPGNIAVDGDFGVGTHQAVLAFQSAHGLMVDGVVGNQTWAALREEPPQEPSTDGRAPHTYVEQGAEARWTTDHSDDLYYPVEDQLVIGAYNTGNAPIASHQFTATGTLTSATGQEVHLQMAGYSVDGQPIQPGGFFQFGAGNIRTQAGTGQFTIAAYMPGELGGDHFSSPITIT